MCAGYPISFELLTDGAGTLYDNGVTDVEWATLPNVGTVTYNAGDYYTPGQTYVNGSAVEITFQSFPGMPGPYQAQVKVNLKNACGWTGMEGDPATYIFPENGNVQIADCGLNHIFKVSPNPARHTITISAVQNNRNEKFTKLYTKKYHGTASIKAVKIFNASGKLSMQQQFNGNTTRVQLDISKLSDGIYLIEISNEQYKETQKLVINR